MGLVIREATKADIDAINGVAQSPTTRALVAEVDGVKIGIGGYYIREGRYYGFRDLSSTDAAPYRLAIARAAKRFMRDAEKRGIKRMYTIVDFDEPRALCWVTSLGFWPDDHYRKLYRWSAN